MTSFDMVIAMIFSNQDQQCENSQKVHNFVCPVHSTRFNYNYMQEKDTFYLISNFQLITSYQL